MSETRELTLLWMSSMRYSKMLEESAFHGRRADYVWFLLVSGTILLVRSSFLRIMLHLTSAHEFTSLQILSPLSPSPFLSSSLSFTVRLPLPSCHSPTDTLTPQLAYLWSRLNPLVRLSLFGVITITAPNLPFVLCLFSWALSSGGSGWGLGVIMGDALGLFTGHIWYVHPFYLSDGDEIEMR